MLAGIKLGKPSPDAQSRKPLFAANASPVSREGWMLPKAKSSSDLLKEAEMEEAKNRERRKKEVEDSEKAARLEMIEAKGGIIYTDPKKSPQKNLLTEFAMKTLLLEMEVRDGEKRHSFVHQREQTHKV